MLKAIVFCPNWVGDVVMATPALRALRNSLPDAHLVGCMRPYVAATIDPNPWFNQTILYDHKSKNAEQRTMSVLRQLRADRFDMAVLLTNSFRTGMLAWLSGIKKRVGFARDGRSLLLTHRVSAKRDGWHFKVTPVIDSYLELVEHAGAKRDNHAMELFTHQADDLRAQQLLKDWKCPAGTPYVVLNPGAAFGAAKRWPSQYFAELARTLVDQYHAHVVVLCGPNERGFAKFIADASARPRMVHSLAEVDVSIGLSKSLVKHARMMVTTDSGPRHFASAFNVPVVSLFGPTHIGWTETYAPQELKLQKQVPCGPCQQRECPLQHHRCMTELSVQEVAAACQQLWDQSIRRAG